MDRSSVRAVSLLALIVSCGALPGCSPATEPEARADTEPAAAEDRVLVVSIEGPINRVQGAFLHRVLAGAGDEFDGAVFVLDTPGGRIDVMSTMSDEIAGLDIPTVSFIDGWALSAGAFVAMSADRIYMTPGGIIGAARAYIPGPDGVPVQLPEDVAEKFASVNRAQFRALAEQKGYPPAIAEAMTDESIEVVKVEYDGEVQYLTGDELEAIRADPIEKERLRVIDTVSAAGKLITFTAKEAVTYDVATKVLPDLDAVLSENGWSEKTVIRREQEISDKVVAFLTSRPIVSLLVLLGFAGVWLELKMPGFGVPGTVAALAFVLVFASQFVLGNAHAAEILLFIVGLALLGIELFITPGFGVMGGAGIACLFVSLILAMQPFVVPARPWEVEALQVNLLATLIGVGGSFVVLLVAAWLIPGTPIFNRLTLQTEMKADEGFGSGVREGQALVGRVGTVITGLRPAGTMRIDDKRYSVVSDGEFAPAGGRARVIRVDGPRIVVAPVAQEGEKKAPDFAP